MSRLFLSRNWGWKRRRVQSVLPLLERYQVSAFMNGHDHCIQHIKPPGSVVDYHTIGSAAINGPRDRTFLYHPPPPPRPERFFTPPPPPPRPAPFLPSFLPQFQHV
jgi:hypothetical protein